MSSFDLLQSLTEDPESLVRKARTLFVSPTHTHSEVDPTSFMLAPKIGTGKGLTCGRVW
jgi:hypothetical protein